MASCGKTGPARSSRRPPRRLGATCPGWPRAERPTRPGAPGARHGAPDRPWRLARRTVPGGSRAGPSLAARAPAARRAVPGSSPAMPRHAVLSSHSQVARGYDVDAATTSVGLPGRDIHAVCQRRRPPGIPGGVWPGARRCLGRAGPARGSAWGALGRRAGVPGARWAGGRGWRAARRWRAVPGRNGAQPARALPGRAGCVWFSVLASEPPRRADVGEDTAEVVDEMG
jgi:hypothetical protein